MRGKRWHKPSACVNKTLRHKLLIEECRYTVFQNDKKRLPCLNVEVKQDENYICLLHFPLSPVFSLDLSLMSYYWHQAWVNTSAITTSDDKWIVLYSARARYHIWHARDRVLLYRSPRKQVLRACTLQSFPQIFFSSFSPLHELFFFHLAGFHQ